MSDIKNLITEYEIDKLDGLFIDSDKITDSQFQKIYVYNNNKGILQKYWLISPKLRIFRDTIPLNDKFRKSVPLSLLIHPMTENIKKFKLYIKKLERKIVKLINKKTKNIYSIKKIYDDFPEILNIKMPFSKYDDLFEFEFHIYKNRKRVNVNELTNSTNVSVFMELSDIWLSNGKLGFNWNVRQMKVYPVYDFTQYLFSDSDEEEYITEETTECYHCLYCPNKHTRTCYYKPTLKKDITIPPPPIYIPKYSPDNTTSDKPSFVPSLQDLLNIKLKPISKDLHNTKVDDNNVKLDNIKQAKDNLLDLE